MIETKPLPREQLTLEAARAALQVRAAHELGLRDAVCVYDACERIGVEVRFVDGLPSMEGLYVEGARPHILISSLRPPGRQAFTGAHELGHHVFGHGGHIDGASLSAVPIGDEYLEPKEFLANQFAAFFLMPKTTVLHGFSSRGWHPASSSPLQLYIVAGWLGVGYTTLIYHMRSNLRLLTWSQAIALSRVPPKRLRLEVLGREEKNNLIIADIHWHSRPVDAQVGDMIALPPGTCQSENKGRIIRVEEMPGMWLYQALKPGIERVYHNDAEWAAFVRVSRRNFAGRSIFRHLEDPDDD